MAKVIKEPSRLLWSVNVPYWCTLVAYDKGHAPLRSRASDYYVGGLLKVCSRIGIRVL